MLIIQITNSLSIKVSFAIGVFPLLCFFLLCHRSVLSNAIKSHLSGVNLFFMMFLLFCYIFGICILFLCLFVFSFIIKWFLINIWNDLKKINKQIKICGFIHKIALKASKLNLCSSSQQQQLTQLKFVS